jgi:hypothetical protein
MDGIEISRSYNSSLIGTSFSTPPLTIDDPNQVGERLIQGQLEITIQDSGIGIGEEEQ